MTEKTSNIINKPKKKKLSLKDKIYSENLTKYKGKQTKAYQATYPDSSYNSARANGVRKTKQLIAKDSEFSLNKITPSYIIEKLDNLASTARKDSDKIACLQLLGRFKALFTDKVQTKGELELKEPTKEDISEIEELINRFKRGYTKN